MLSKETLLQLLPFIDNPKEEIEKLDEEQEQDTEGFGVYQNFAKAFQPAEKEETQPVKGADTR